MWYLIHWVMGSFLPMGLPHSAVEWSGLLGGQDRGINPCSASMILQGQNPGFCNCFLQGSTKGSLVEGFRHATHFLILPGRLRNCSSKCRQSVPWPTSLSNTIAASCHSTQTPGVTTLASLNEWPCLCLLHISPLPQQPPSAEIHISVSTRTGSQSQHSLVAEMGLGGDISGHSGFSVLLADG